MLRTVWAYRGGNMVVGDDRFAGLCSRCDLQLGGLLHRPADVRAPTALFCIEAIVVHLEADRLDREIIRFGSCVTQVPLNALARC